MWVMDCSLIVISNLFLMFFVFLNSFFLYLVYNLVCHLSIPSKYYMSNEYTLKRCNPIPPLLVIDII